MLLKKDILIVGGGVAGLYTALSIPEHLSIGILMKTKYEESNSYLAQGGIAICTELEDIPKHIEDTLLAGGDLCNKKAVRLLVQQGKGCLEKLLELGVPFDRTEAGELEKTKEGGHSIRRIFHANKDATGRALTHTLYEAAKKKSNIEIYEEAFGLDLILKENRCIGTYGLWKGKKAVFQGKAMIVASGGIGQLYKHTTNPKAATGDGIAMAARAGAVLKDMEFIQFHPTAFFASSQTTEQRFLISEAVRGEGAILRNVFGDRFMEGQHPLKELAPRDIVARAIFHEMQKTNADFVYLDLSHKGAEFIKNRFPNIYQFCLGQGIDITKEAIPVTPAQHYFMGGVAVDLKGRTSIKGLYACGECSNTGVHGGNRLASNSLLEAMVFGEQIAQDISENLSLVEGFVEGIEEIDFWNCEEEKLENKVDIKQMREDLQDLMQSYAGIIRKQDELQFTKKKLEQMLSVLKQNLQKTQEYYEIYNMVWVAKAVIQGAINRKESFGSHYIENEGAEGHELVYSG